MGQSTIRWPITIVTDARDVYEKVSTEKAGLPQQEVLTLEIATIREWLVTSGALIRGTADEHMITNGLTEDHRESRKTLGSDPARRRVEHSNVCERQVLRVLVP